MKKKNAADVIADLYGQQHQQEIHNNNAHTPNGLGEMMPSFSSSFSASYYFDEDRWEKEKGGAGHSSLQTGPSSFQLSASTKSRNYSNSKIKEEDADDILFDEDNESISDILDGTNSDSISYILDGPDSVSVSNILDAPDDDDDDVAVGNNHNAYSTEDADDENSFQRQAQLPKLHDLLPFLKDSSAASVSSSKKEEELSVKSDEKKRWQANVKAKGKEKRRRFTKKKKKKKTKNKTLQGSMPFQQPHLPNLHELLPFLSQSSSNDTDPQGPLASAVAMMRKSAIRVEEVEESDDDDDEEDDEEEVDQLEIQENTSAEESIEVPLHEHDATTAAANAAAATSESILHLQTFRRPDESGHSRDEVPFNDNHDTTVPSNAHHSKTTSNQPIYNSSYHQQKLPIPKPSSMTAPPAAHVVAAEAPERHSPLTLESSSSEESLGSFNAPKHTKIEQAQSADSTGTASLPIRLTFELTSNVTDAPDTCGISFERKVSNGTKIRCNMLTKTTTTTPLMDGRRGNSNDNAEATTIITTTGLQFHIIPPAPSSTSSPVTVDFETANTLVNLISEAERRIIVQYFDDADNHSVTFTSVAISNLYFMKDGYEIIKNFVLQMCGCSPGGVVNTTGSLSPLPSVEALNICNVQLIDKPIKIPDGDDTTISNKSGGTRSTSKSSMSMSSSSSLVYRIAIAFWMQPLASLELEGAAADEDNCGNDVDRSKQAMDFDSLCVLLETQKKWKGLSYLKLCNLELTPNHAKRLADALRLSQLPLQYLDLSFNQLGQQGIVKYIADYVVSVPRTVNHNLAILNVESNDLDTSGAVALFTKLGRQEHLQDGDDNLIHIWLEKNNPLDMVQIALQLAFEKQQAEQTSKELKKMNNERQSMASASSAFTQTSQHNNIYSRENEELKKTIQHLMSTQTAMASEIQCLRKENQNLKSLRKENQNLKSLRKENQNLKSLRKENQNLKDLITVSNSPDIQLLRQENQSLKQELRTISSSSGALSSSSSTTSTTKEKKQKDVTQEKRRNSSHYRSSTSVPQHQVLQESYSIDSTQGEDEPPPPPPPPPLPKPKPPVAVAPPSFSRILYPSSRTRNQHITEVKRNNDRGRSASFRLERGRSASVRQERSIGISMSPPRGKRVASLSPIRGGEPSSPAKSPTSRAIKFFEKFGTKKNTNSTTADGSDGYNYKPTPHLTTKLLSPPPRDKKVSSHLNSKVITKEDIRAKVLARVAHTHETKVATNVTTNDENKNIAANESPTAANSGREETTTQMSEEVRRLRQGQALRQERAKRQGDQQDHQCSGVMPKQENSVQKTQQKSSNSALEYKKQKNSVQKQRLSISTTDDSTALPKATRTPTAVHPKTAIQKSQQELAKKAQKKENKRTKNVLQNQLSVSTADDSTAGAIPRVGALARAGCIPTASALPKAVSSPAGRQKAAVQKSQQVPVKKATNKLQNQLSICTTNDSTANAALPRAASRSPATRQNPAIQKNQQLPEKKAKKKPKKKPVGSTIATHSPANQRKKAVPTDRGNRPRVVHKPSTERTSRNEEQHDQQRPSTKAPDKSVGPEVSQQSDNANEFAGALKAWRKERDKFIEANPPPVKEKVERYRPTIGVRVRENSIPRLKRSSSHKFQKDSNGLPSLEQCRDESQKPESRSVDPATDKSGRNRKDASVVATTTSISSPKGNRDEPAAIIATTATIPRRRKLGKALPAKVEPKSDKPTQSIHPAADISGRSQDDALTTETTSTSMSLKGYLDSRSARSTRSISICNDGDKSNTAASTTTSSVKQGSISKAVQHKRESHSVPPKRESQSMRSMRSIDRIAAYLKDDSTSADPATTSSKGNNTKPNGPQRIKYKTLVEARQSIITEDDM